LLQINSTFFTVRSLWFRARELISFLQDIRQALSPDLTAKGVEAAKPLHANAGPTATRVQTALTEAASILTALSGQMSLARGLAGN
jgi:hypothetical protein